MSKTKEIVVVCNEVHTETNWDKNVLVTLKEPNVNDLLDNINEEELNQWVRNNKEPDALFNAKDLGKWAEDNGYIKQ
jgi:hypothetical protein